MTMTTRKTTRSWRDEWPIHPAAELLPLMSPDELRTVGADIKANGLKQPVVLINTPNACPGHALLDGRNRLDAMEAVGLVSVVMVGLVYNVSLPDGAVVYAPDDVDPYAYVLSANAHRRHLTAEQKRELVAKVLRAQPGNSNRKIAAQVKTDGKTVAAVRQKLEGRAEIPHVETRQDSKGRQQPARKTKAATAEEQQAPGPPPADLFEPDIERVDADADLDLTELKTHNKRLRAKIKTLRKTLRKHVERHEEALRQEKLWHDATHRQLGIARGEIEGARADEFVRVLCLIPGAAKIIEQAIWGLGDEEQEALLKSIAPACAQIAARETAAADDVPAFLRRGSGAP